MNTYNKNAFSCTYSVKSELNKTIKKSLNYMYIQVTYVSIKINSNK